MINFRVRAYAPGEEDIILEKYEARSDAEQFYKELQAEDSNILTAHACRYDSVCIRLEEFYNGEWTTVSVKTVDLR